METRKNCRAYYRGRGVTRGAALRTSKHSKVGQIQRPLQKLYPLEIEEDIEDDTADDTKMEGQVDSKASGSGNSGVHPVGVLARLKKISKDCYPQNCR